MNGKLIIRANLPAWGDQIELRAAYDSGAASLGVIQPVKVEQMEEGSYIAPFLLLKRDCAQQLMDELWGCGLRPSEGSGSAGALAATERHLEDMRSLVFKTPPKERK
ncbi:MAG TPA: hypothetical protein VJ652_15300 [Noviherbaspirillum sp.]|nr:hypothetical protein [Noviherbaspirillum sp.]